MKRILIAMAAFLGLAGMQVPPTPLIAVLLAVLWLVYQGGYRPGYWLGSN